MAPPNGVFVCSEKRDRDIIEACQKRLVDAHIPGKIEHVKKDYKYKGFRVCFKDSGTVRELLKTKYLCIKGENSSIHPIVTKLTVHDAMELTEEDLGDLRAQMLQMGPVLEVSKVPISDEYPEIGNGDWRVVLNVAENEEFAFFKARGLPDNMNLKLPRIDQSFRVTVNCYFCGRDGHSSQRCPVVYRRNSISQDDRELAIVPVRQIIDLESEIQEVEAVERSEGRSEPNSNPVIVRVDLETPKNYTLEDYSGKMFHDYTSVVQAEVHPEASSSTFDLPCPATFTIDDDSVDIFEHMGYVQSTSQDVYDDADVVSTSNVGLYVTARDELSSTDENDPELNELSVRKKTYKKMRISGQSKKVDIPDTIREVMEQTSGVLNPSQLEAFFNHTKKKQSPINIARQYTSDVDGLKSQLQEISQKIDTMTATPTSAEKHFATYLRNVLSRLEPVSTRSRRKKN